MARSKKQKLTANEQVDAIANELGEQADVVRGRLLELGLQTRAATAQRDQEARERAVDIILMTTTSDEYTQLKEVATSLGLKAEKRHGYLRLTGTDGLTVGGQRVAVARLGKMGSFGPEGAAAGCISACSETQATTVILLGIAFGATPAEQRLGDVLVSHSLFLYDRRDVRDVDTVPARFQRLLGVLDWVRGRIATPLALPSYRSHYGEDARKEASEYWIARFQASAMRLASTEFPATVTVGTLLSGGALVNSPTFLRDLVASVGALEPPIVGGEMEGAGLVSVDQIGWIVVKAICDFGDYKGRSGEKFKVDRRNAARNAATVVLTTLMEGAP